MAKNTKKQVSKPTTPPVSDRTLYFSNLSYFPSEYKESKAWCAQMLWFIKNNSQVLQDAHKAKVYRDTDVLKINKKQLKDIIDPPTPKSTGGEATYFSADWGAMPIDVHLDNILDTEVRSGALNITCKIADPIVKLKEQKDKEKIIYQGMVRNIVNDFAKELGLPEMQSSENPYKWIKKFNAKGKDKDSIDTVGGVIGQIQNKIKDDDTMRLFLGYLYKNGLELAFEIGIKYFMVDQNEFQTKFSHDFLRDLKHFNKMCGRAAVDEMTGEKIIRYYDPTKLWTNNFKYRNGDDILYWFYEEDLTFADFESLCGSTLDYDAKRKALELQKSQGWNWGSVSNTSANNSTKIRVGFCSVLTQEDNNFSERYINDKTSVWKSEPLTWRPEEDSDENRKVKTYNVWQTFYYLPLNIYEYNANSAINWEEQSKYIFHIRKEVDMMRYGKDGRYTKSSLVIWKNDTQPSWTDIKQAYMPKINLLWQEFQNCIVQDVDAIAMSNELIAGMANAVDESNSKGDGGQSQIDQWKMLKQAHQGFFNFKDKNGNPVADPKNMFIQVKNGLFEKAEQILLRIMDLYNLMTQSLAKGQAGEGIQPKARTATAGIEIANEAANKATFFIRESYNEGVVVQFAMRFAQHIYTVCKEKTKYNYAERWKIFNDVIGRYNGAELEGIEKINFENIGLTIENKDDSAKRELVLQTIIKEYANKQISTAGLALAIGSDNYKLQLVELALEQKKQEEKAQQQQQAEFQRQMQLKQMDLKIAQALQQSKTEGKNSNIQTQGQTDAAVQGQMNQLKAQNMKEQKDQLLKNKLIQDRQKAELKKDEKTHQANLEQQSALV